MKKAIYLTLISLVVLFTSCRKDFDNPTPKVPATMEDLKIPADFDWKTIKDIQLTLTGYANSIVEVTSPEGVVYQKSFLTRNEPYIMKLTVPTYERSLRLKYMGQNIELELSSGTIEYIFN
jgi:hypothetical protein